MEKIKPEMGGKYCFGDPKRLQSAYGYNVKLYKVKSGDTLSDIASKHPGVTNVDDHSWKVSAIQIGVDVRFAIK